MSYQLPNFEPCFEFDSDWLMGFDIFGHLGPDEIEPFLAELPTLLDECGVDVDDQDFFGPWDASHAYRYEDCAENSCLEECDTCGPKCPCEKAYFYARIPTEGSELVTHLEPAAGAFNGQMCWRHPYEPATARVPNGWWPEPVRLNPQKYVDFDPTYQHPGLYVCRECTSKLDDGQRAWVDAALAETQRVANNGFDIWTGRYIADEPLLSW